MAQRLDRAFFEVPARTLARRLLGMTLVRELGGRRLAGRIVETEAYVGVKDRCCHSFGGRRTPRNESMYAAAGTCYVYFTYGMHHCMNIVCGEPGEPVAVLLRALEPIEGLDAMHANRAGRSSAARRGPRDLCGGPGKLCAALAIDRSLNGLDLCGDGPLWLERGRVVARAARTPRIGVGEGAWAEKPLRWLDPASPHVSGKKSGLVGAGRAVYDRGAARGRRAR
ncbi:MAG: DNA-3-methyladenine glycosylase [Phycisphaeraceae bacterium]|nr:MAG: DNA-3-methyladenine glycosylase [Phycisphaeraceae bacterium]